MSKKVLIAVDGSETSEKAAKWYVENISRETDTVILGYVSEEALTPTFAFRAGLAVTPHMWKELERDAKEKADKVKQTFSDIISTKGLAHKFVHEAGQNVGHHICDIAKNRGVNMIVMGSRGLGTVRRTILGSVSDYVLHHAHVPVLIYHE